MTYLVGRAESSLLLGNRLLSSFALSRSSQVCLLVVHVKSRGCKRIIGSELRFQQPYCYGSVIAVICRQIYHG